MGSYLISQLVSQGHKVRALVREPGAQAGSKNSLPGKAVDVRMGDVVQSSDLSSVFEGTEVVFHLAARISISRYDGGAVLDTNIGGTKNVLAACQKAGVRRLIHMSSVHAIDSAQSRMPMDENSPRVTSSAGPAYDLSKATAEQEVLFGGHTDLETVVLSPSGIMGPFDHAPSRIGRTLIDMARGRFPMVPTGRYNFVDVRDVVGAAIAAVDKARPGEKYLVTGEVASVRQLHDWVCEAGGSKPPGWNVPLRLLMPVARVAESFAHYTGRSPLLTPQSLEILENPCEFSFEKARQELGYAPRSLKQSVADSLDWFRAHGLL